MFYSLDFLISNIPNPKLQERVRKKEVYADIVYIPGEWYIGIDLLTRGDTRDGWDNLRDELFQFKYNPRYYSDRYSFYRIKMQ